MFHDYRSNNLTSLSDKFLELIAKEMPKDPFQKNWIIVQNREMQRWLTLQQALKNSISANQEFIFPSEFIWKLYRVKNPELSTNLPSDRISMQWSIFELLSSDNKLLRDIAGDRKTDQRQLLQLSEAISDVFDLYQVFRPELIESWQDEKLGYNNRSEIWQSVLWRKLRKKWNKNPDSVTRVDAFKDLSSWIRSNEYPFERLPSNIWSFSIPQISNPFSDILALISSAKEVYNFGYSYEKNSDSSEPNSFINKLLKSQFDSISVINDSIKRLGKGVDKVLLTDIEPSTSKLSSIQQVLKGLSIDSVNHDEDESFQIHSCHSKKREVEVLKDRLLHAFNRDSDLKPEDCMVLVPNLDEYQQLLSDVLSNEINEVNLPFGKGFEDLTTLRNETLLELLSVLNSDFKVNSVLDLIDNPIISEKWGFSESDLQILRNWAVDLHIHHGVDDSVFSWKTGLDRLFLSFAMIGDPYKTYDEKSVYNGSLDSDSLTLLAKFSAFMSLLEKESNQLSKPLTISDWIKKTTNVTDQFLHHEYDKGFKVIVLKSELEKLKKSVEVSASTQLIDLDLFLSWFRKQLSTYKSNSSSFGHGINISEYVPNRNIPHKFVAILGLTENTFPSPVTRPSFDLIHQFPEPGDRIEQHEQRYLFFDLIHAAQQTLHISFIGESRASQIDKSPSVLIQELIDVCKRHKISIDIIKHRLHGFENSYFNKQDLYLKSFSEQKKSLSNSVKTDSFLNLQLLKNYELASDYLDNRDVLISDLISYYSHPPKYLSNQVLDISSYEDILDPEDRELFETKQLDRYFLKDFLQEAFFENLDQNELKLASKAKGLIPEGFPGEVDFNASMSLITRLEEVKSNYDFNLKKEMEIEAIIDPYKVSGTISNLIEDTRVEVRLGRLKGKNVMTLWLNHHLLNLDSKSKSHLYYFNTNDSLRSLFIDGDSLNSKLEIKRLIDHYINSLKNPVSNIFPIEISFEYAKSLLDSDSNDKAIKDALAKWKTWGVYSECDDYYNSLLHNTSDFIHEDDFQKTSEKLWLPILKSIGDIE